MKKIIILGGSFDPFHNGHLNSLKVAQKELNFDQVWLLIAPNARWKTKQTPVKKRLEMLQLVISNNNDFYLCDEELYIKKKIRTYDTMIRLINKYPNYQFHYLIGTDQLNRLDDWYNIDELAKIVQFVVVKRKGYEINKELINKYNCILLNNIPLEISSSNIKDTLDFSLIPSYLKEFLLNDLYYHKKKLKLVLSKERYQHSIRVMRMSQRIAKSNKIPPFKAKIAGLLHDLAKEIDNKIEMQIMTEHFKNNLDDSPNVYHQFVGSFLLKQEFGINDLEIEEAIRYHTTGCGNMSSLAKIIYVADKIEPSRKYDSSTLLKLALKDINKGFEATVESMIAYKERRNIVATKETKECFEKYGKRSKNS